MSQTRIRGKGDLINISQEGTHWIQCKANASFEFLYLGNSNTNTDYMDSHPTEVQISSEQGPFKSFLNFLKFFMYMCVFTHVCGYPKNVEKNVKFPRVTGESELGVIAGNEPSIMAARNQINLY